MDFSIFEEMDKDKLQEYLKFLFWHYRVIDSFWFIYVTEQYDQPTAERLNEKVWSRAGSMGAKDILKRFNYRERLERVCQGTAPLSLGGHCRL